MNWTALMADASGDMASSGGDEGASFNNIIDEDSPFGEEEISAAEAAEDEVEPKPKPQKKKPAHKEQGLSPNHERGKVLRLKDVDGSDTDSDTDTDKPKDSKTTSSPVPEGLEDFFKSKLQKKEAKQASEPEADKELLEGIEEGSRPHERIRNLIRQHTQEKAQYEEGIKHAQDNAWQQYNALQQYQQAANQEIVKLREEVARLTATQQTMEKYQQPQSYEEDPIAKMQAEWQDKIAQTIDQRLQPFQEQIKKQQEYLATEARKAQVNQIKARQSQLTDDALMSHLYGDLDVDTVKQVHPLMTRLTTALALDGNTTPDVAAQQARDLFLRVSLGFVKAQAAAGQAQHAKSKSVPQPAPKGMGGALGSREPSYEELSANGYVGLSALADWESDGRPPLRRLKQA